LYYKRVGGDLRHLVDQNYHKVVFSGEKWPAMAVLPEKNHGTDKNA